MCLPQCSICKEGSFTAHESYPTLYTEDQDLDRFPAQSSSAPAPSVFSRVLMGRCAEPDDFDDVAEERHLEQSRLLHEAMMTFIRTLLRGICIEVLLDDGSSLFPETSLNYELTHLILDVNEAQRTIPLEDVEGVVTPEELEERKILTSIRPYLDERCCTLIIRDFEFVTFRFDTERLREYFSTCLMLLIARGDDCREEMTLQNGGRQLPAGASGPRPGPRAALPLQNPLSGPASESVTQEARLLSTVQPRENSKGVMPMPPPQEGEAEGQAEQPL